MDRQLFRGLARVAGFPHHSDLEVLRGTDASGAGHGAGDPTEVNVTHKVTGIEAGPPMHAGPKALCVEFRSLGPGPGQRYRTSSANGG